jgi:hypothetical protein
MTGERGRHTWRNLDCFLAVVLALAAVGLAVGVTWWQVDAFLHPHRHMATQMPAGLGQD